MLILLVSALLSAIAPQADVPIVGAIADMTGTCATQVTITVASVKIRVDNNTKIQNGTCADLERGQRVTISASDAAGVLHATTVTLPGPEDPEAQKLVQRLGYRIVEATVANLVVPAESVAPVSERLFGPPVGICVGEVDRTKPIDIVLFVVPPSGIAMLDAEDDCALVRKETSFRSLLAVKLSAAQRSTIFEYLGNSYLLTVQIHARPFRQDYIVVDIYRAAASKVAAAAAPAGAAPGAGGVAPTPGAPGSGTPGAGTPAVATPVPVAAARPKISVANIRSEDCARLGAPTVTPSQDQRAVTFEWPDLKVEARGADDERLTCRLTFDLMLPDRFRATFAAARYTLRATAAGKGRAVVSIRHGVTERRTRWSQPPLPVFHDMAAAILSVPDPPISSCGGTRHFAIDLALRASGKESSDSATARVTAIEVDTGANDMITLEACK